MTEAIKRAEREAGLAMMSKLARADGPVTLAAEYQESKNWPNWLLPSERSHPLFAMA